jgi:hypothetical protein
MIIILFILLYYYMILLLLLYYYYCFNYVITNRIRKTSIKNLDIDYIINLTMSFNMTNYES